MADPPRGCSHEPLLEGTVLVALQLLARGYTPEQIAALQGRHVVDVHQDFLRAARALGAATPREALAEARRRDLIV